MSVLENPSSVTDEPSSTKVSLSSQVTYDWTPGRLVLSWEAENGRRGRTRLDAEDIRELAYGMRHQFQARVADGDVRVKAKDLYVRIAFRCPMERLGTMYYEFAVPHVEFLGLLDLLWDWVQEQPAA